MLNLFQHLSLLTLAQSKASPYLTDILAVLLSTARLVSPEGDTGRNNTPPFPHTGKKRSKPVI
jgi:hypothetical protein